MTAAELLAVGAAKTPFDIVRAAYGELLVGDLDASERFYVDLLGLIVSDRAEDRVYLRGWEERLHHSLVLRRAPGPASAPAVERLSFRVRSEDDLSLLHGALEARGCQTRWVGADHLGMGRALRAWDPFGC